MTHRSLIAMVLLLASTAVTAENVAPVTVAPGTATAPEVVGTTCPTFHWGHAGTADGFELAIHAADATHAAALVTRELPGVATGWTPSLDQCLAAGERYAWRIRATGAAGDSAWSDWSHFGVAPQGSPAAPTATAAKGAPASQLNVAGGVVATTFAGDGSALTNVDAATLDGVNGTGYTVSNQSCGAGLYVSGIDATGNVVCAALADYVNQSCHVYFGWRDACDACSTAPAKWGRASGTSCENGAGANGTCATTVLGGASIPLYGLNPDGDVDDVDKFYVGLKCF